MPRHTHRVLGIVAACGAVLACGGCGGAADDVDGASGAATGGDVVARASVVTTGATTPSGSGARGGVIVDVAGMVRTPGVYELPRGARVHDAIAAAGGVRPGAVLAGLNRAAEVVDGQQVLVPATTSATNTGSPVTAAGPEAKVSINSADVAALDELPGIGPVTAQRIVDDRTANGPFADVADLGRVSGIGAATIADLESRVTP